jgi:hypothetical protein
MQSGFIVYFAQLSKHKYRSVPGKRSLWLLYQLGWTGIVMGKNKKELSQQQRQQ